MMEIRRADKGDIPGIMRFIHLHWKENHILSKDQEFFEWMYVDDTGVNFVIAIEQETIYGVNGFIKYNEDNYPDISGALWKVIPTGNPVLGLELAEFINTFTLNRLSFGIGMNPRTAARIAKLNGEEIKKMDHFYLLNKESSYSIAQVQTIPFCEVASEKEYKLIPVPDYEKFKGIFDEDILRQISPIKSKEFFNRRYYQHPVYSYSIWGIQKEDESMDSFIVTRMVNHAGANMIKIVDFRGIREDLQYIGKAIHKMLADTKSEFIDLYCTGISEQILQKAGFSLRTAEDTNIIPNYFEPFEQRNVEIYVGATSLNGVCMFRGDGDQDRPSARK